MQKTWRIFQDNCNWSKPRRVHVNRECLLVFTPDRAYAYLVSDATTLRWPMQAPTNHYKRHLKLVQLVAELVEKLKTKTTRPAPKKTFRSTCVAICRRVGKLLKNGVSPGPRSGSGSTLCLLLFLRTILAG